MTTCCVSVTLIVTGNTETDKKLGQPTVGFEDEMPHQCKCAIVGLDLTSDHSTVLLYVRPVQLKLFLSGSVF